MTADRDAELLRKMEFAALTAMHKERGYSPWLMIRTSDWFAILVAIVAALAALAWAML